MSTSNTQTPGSDPMGDTLGFMKNLWAGVKMPGMTMPSLSVEDVNKQITDLKTVETWLGLNMSMLRASIQALEVQSATLTALQSMGKTVGESMGSMEKAMGAAMGAAGSMAGFNPMHAGASTDTAGTGSAPAGGASGVAADSTFSFAPPTADKPPAPESEPEIEKVAAQAEDHAGDMAAAAAPFVNPAAWWGMLQDQFKQAVGKAMAPEAEPVAIKRKPAAKSAKPAAHPANRSARKPGSASIGKPARKLPKAAAPASKSRRTTAAAKNAPTGKAAGGAARGKSAAVKGGSTGAGKKAASARKRG
ncbi:PhaM family polyhydroxyalkanoate granule multifunctional regulatory protein [Lacisediminimonas sp.]|uniref:PhaM family polyhydroxyalkanoate granule multifunctional regulatory protein n=1 Tax=Lacisediminimonas sp. TaxID=3060582 RepID=UPI002724CD06|nr:PhaM family polyhydroxyalkanoate granule multifunctional regulatory protein [Lacisediminimonas sp.]MDO8300523.1 pilus assembly protein FimV [Lacisediminimonas sp.]